jgi:hypothetical protein
LPVRNRTYLFRIAEGRSLISAPGRKQQSVAGDEQNASGDWQQRDHGRNPFRKYPNPPPQQYTLKRLYTVGIVHLHKLAPFRVVFLVVGNGQIQEKLL